MRGSVLLLARPGDDCADVVEGALLAQGVPVSRLSLNTLRRSSFTFAVERQEVLVSDQQFRVNQATTIWYRRPGWVEVENLSFDEAQLVQAECESLLFGSLMAVTPRWIDLPELVSAAERKPAQIAAALRQGIHVPPSLITNDPTKAQSFRKAVGRIVAKASSSGPGLAPYVSEVRREHLEFVATAPVLLQALVQANADVRVVVVGNRAFWWRRQRSADEPIDWREADPAGSGFQFWKEELSEETAPVRLAREMGLSFAVQDWLDAESGLVFLELNPVGEWLFLNDAKERVQRALTAMLVGHV